MYKSFKKIFGYLLAIAPPLFFIFYLIPWLGTILEFVFMCFVSVISIIGIIAIMCFGISLAIDGEKK